MKCLGHLVVLGLDSGEHGEQLQQVAIIFHLQTGLLAQRLIEQVAGDAQFHHGHAGTQLDGTDVRPVDAVALTHLVDDRPHLAQPVELGAALPNGGVEGVLDGMPVGQSVHPGRKEQLQLLDGELVQDGLDDGRNVLLRETLTVYGHTGDPVATGDVGRHGLGVGIIGVLGVEQHQKRFAQLLQLLDDPCFRF